MKIMNSLLAILLIILSASNAVAACENATAGEIHLFSQIRKELNDFKNECGRYPTTAEGLIALTETPTTVKCEYRTPVYWPGRIRDKVNDLDAWHRTIHYISDGKIYRIDGANGFFLKNNTSKNAQGEYWERDLKAPQVDDPPCKDFINNR
jgi:hypothetical protein